MLSRFTSIRSLTRRSFHRSLATRTTVVIEDEIDDLKPWGNECSSSGTTHKTIRLRTSGNKTVDPDKEMFEVEVENEQAAGEPHALSWSAANKDISAYEEEGAERTHRVPPNPSAQHTHPPRPPPQQGLFKPLSKKPSKHLD